MALATHTGILSSVQSTRPPGRASSRTHCSSTTRCNDFHIPRHLLLEGIGPRSLLTRAPLPPPPARAGDAQIQKSLQRIRRFGGMF